MVRAELTQCTVQNNIFYRVYLNPRISFFYFLEQLLGYDKFMAGFAIKNRNGIFNNSYDEHVFFKKKEDAEKFMDWLDANIIVKELIKKPN